MDLLTQDFPDAFLNPSELPCISLYQPTHRSHPDNKQDVIRFKNLTKEIQHSLEKKYSKEQVQTLIKPFHELEENASFWNHTQEGLAILANTEFFKIYKLPSKVPELSIVADSFHIKPLIRMMQSVNRYQILALNRQEIKLFEGNRDEIELIELAKEVHETINKALGGELTNPHLTVSSYGMGATGSPMHHGHGGKKDEIAMDVERFFRAVDQDILKYHSHTSKLPLLLAALPEYHHMFHKISQNPYLLSEGIQINPEGLTLDELRVEAWKHIEPLYLARLDTLIKEFHEAQSKEMATDQLKDIGHAAVSGRISTLLIDANCQIPGTINHESGDIKMDELLNPEVDDVLDDLGELVLKTKGEVIIVSGEKMPTKTGVIAIYRY